MNPCVAPTAVVAAFVVFTMQVATHVAPAGRGSGYGVVAAVAERVTAADTLYRQPPTPQSAMAADGFRGILGATGRKPAVVAQEGAEQELVGPDKELEQPRHGCKSACF